MRWKSSCTRYRESFVKLHRIVSVIQRLVCRQFYGNHLKVKTDWIIFVWSNSLGAVEMFHYYYSLLLSRRRLILASSRCLTIKPTDVITYVNHVIWTDWWMHFLGDVNSKAFLFHLQSRTWNVHWNAPPLWSHRCVGGLVQLLKRRFLVGGLSLPCAQSIVGRNVAKLSAIGQRTRPTQPSIPLGSVSG